MRHPPAWVWGWAGTQLHWAGCGRGGNLTRRRRAYAVRRRNTAGALSARVLARGSARPRRSQYRMFLPIVELCASACMRVARAQACSCCNEKSGTVDARVNGVLNCERLQKVECVQILVPAPPGRHPTRTPPIQPLQLKQNRAPLLKFRRARSSRSSALGMCARCMGDARVVRAAAPPRCPHHHPLWLSGCARGARCSSRGRARSHPSIPLLVHA
jgi:hypothetical protein